jgi:hypothetical protein
MKGFEWMGNPFVDTGLAVIITRAKEIGINVNTVSELTPEIFKAKPVYNLSRPDK